MVDFSLSPEIKDLRRKVASFLDVYLPGRREVRV
jgi:hypothetical protein